MESRLQRLGRLPRPQGFLTATCDARPGRFQGDRKSHNRRLLQRLPRRRKIRKSRRLYLGCRFGFSWLNKIVITAAFEKCDVVTYNIYNDTPNVLKTRLYEGIEDKPVMIGEFHFGAGDRRQFLGEPMPEKFEQRAHEVYEELFKRRNKIPDDNRRPTGSNTPTNTRPADSTAKTALSGLSIFATLQNTTWPPP